VRPRDLTARATLGRGTSRRVTITNTGTAAATYRLAESQRGFTIQKADGTRISSRPRASTPGVPVQRIPSDAITPAVRAAATAVTEAPASRTRTGQAGDPWESIADYPTSITDSAVGSQDGRVYSFGGTVHQVDPSPASYVYNPQTLTWKQLADLPEARQKPAGGFVDGKYYVVAGWGPDGKPGSATLVYDPALDRWRTAAADP